RFLGVMGFGFKIGELFRNALASTKIPAGTAIGIYTHGMSEPLFSLAPDNAGGAAPTRRTLFERKMDFGQGELKFVYAVPRDLQREGFLRGLWVAGAGITMTLATV